LSMSLVHIKTRTNRSSNRWRCQFVGTIFNDYKYFPKLLMEDNPGKLYFMNKILLLSRQIFFLNASKGQCFLQFLHSSRSGSTSFGVSVGCWKRRFQGYEYKIAICAIS
jgi:hypothetical protein